MTDIKVKSSRIEARFYGLTQLLERGYDALPYKFASYCLTELKMTPNELAVVLVIYEHKYRAEDPYPSIAEIAASTRLSYGGVRKILVSLVEKNLIKRVQRPNSLSKETSLRPLMAQLCAIDPTQADANIKAAQRAIEDAEEAKRTQRREKRAQNEESNTEATTEEATAAEVIDLNARRAAQ